MNSKASFFLLFLIFSTTLHHQVSAKKQGHKHKPNLISSSCQAAVNKDLCMTVLQSDPTSNKANIQTLASIAIKYAMNNATAIHDNILQMMNKTENNIHQQCLSDCTEHYLDAIDQLGDSLAALQSKGYKDVTTWVQAAIIDAETCEEGFTEEVGHESLLKESNTVFTQLCGNALAIVKLLQ